MMFEAIKNGKAEVVTDTIDSFTKDGILLDSGNKIDADVVVPPVEAGDFIKVDDGGDGEYRLFIANQADPANSGHLTLIGTADSAVTDAGTLTTTIVHTTGASVVIGNVSQNKKVQTVTVDVTTAFDGTSPTLTVGDAGDTDRLMTNDYLDLTDVATYEATPNFTYTNATDTSILAYFDADSSTTGTAVITITYA